MAIYTRYVASDWVPLIDFALPGSMPHGNNYDSHNIYAIDIVFISIDSQFHWHQIHKQNVSTLRGKCSSTEGKMAFTIQPHLKNQKLAQWHICGFRQHIINPSKPLS